ncbi:carboxymuconolactone decarboxylase family protein [Halothiobacillus sp. DCM-1]|uniref:carboxymuconolactone decarboxylase family protein n=1 Tax=Halothiobacillus sp. DCM-1 TaxID=3112558 RepID=UPI003250B8B4
MTTDMNQTLHDFKQGMGMLSQEAPNTVAAFNQFMETALSPGALDGKTKELIALGMAITARCAYCIGIHVGKVMQAGGTHAEIIEVCQVAILMGGGPALTYVAEVKKALDLFEKSATRGA